MKRLRIAAIIVVVLFLLGVIAVQVYRSHTEQKELEKLSCYKLYSSYFQIRDEYRVYYMVNPDHGKDTVVGELLSDSYIGEIMTEMENTGHGEYPIIVYLISPSDELPYGWKKSELNISANFDLSVFHRNAYCTITIPVDAKSIHDCILEYR